ncbi:sensor domain-containing diguanylate cyclase [Rheinheimera sp. MMS21-TC3]|uniref:sensor domain-containing diguanylate cyclase n=1 Tax=Rheinheimera sp. MMS21-TC3 TaxID=3072790 RepID=UPI0028C43239|nr:sensor domain-containing diguanylate cyclase [Rheinheimera sp. MMS21-TC3]WNO60128.1 sensor domain-containing diguanylate cyclase [Rheinheimera sp. MMS21-TC3]
MIDSNEKGQSKTKVTSRQLLQYFFTLLAIVSLTSAGLLLWQLPALATNFSWLFFFPAIIAISLYAGFYAGIITTILACLTVMFLWPLLLNLPYINNDIELLKIVIFVVTSCLLSYYIESMQQFQKTLTQANSIAAASNKTEQFIHSIIDNTPNMMGYWDRDLRCCYANRAYSEWFGMPASEIIGMTFQQLVGEQLFKLNEPYIKKALAGEAQRFERTLRKANANVGYIIGHYIPDFDDNGVVKGFSIQANEVTQLKETEAKLKLAACVFDNTLDGVLITDAEGVILSVNPSFTDITGFSKQEALGQTPRILQSKQHDQAFYALMWHELTTKSRWHGEIWNRRKDGTLYLQRMHISMVRNDEGEAVRYVSVFSDITEFRRKDEQIKHLAFHDALTDLPNRTLLMDRISQKLLNFNRDQCKLALMFLDLDGFKQVNDQFGHNVGDILLKEMAKRLVALVRQSDTVARVGGDEFIFILNNPLNKIEISEVAERIINSINQPLVIQNNEFKVGVSVGVAMFPEDANSAEGLIRNADTAMYMAKSLGKNKAYFYNSADTVIKV